MRSTLPMLSACAVLAACATTGEAVPRSKGLVRGFVSFTDDGIAQLRECGTDHRYTLGAMAPGTEMRLRERYERLSAEGRDVVAEVSGYLTWNERAGHIEQPSLLKIKAEKCKDND